MITRTADRFDARPTRLAADTGYGSAEMLAWLVDERGIEPHFPVFDKSGRKDGTFSRDDFGYNHETDVYVCPGGKTMTTTGTLTDGAALLYRASKHDCDACELQNPGAARTLLRAKYRVPSMKRPATGHAILPRPTRLCYFCDEEAQEGRDAIRPPQTHPLKLGRLRLRGPCGARDEFLLAATAQKPPQDGQGANPDDAANTRHLRRHEAPT